MLSPLAALDAAQSLGVLPLATFASVMWGLMATVLVIVCVLLIAIILIQDPKGGGLTSAFGAGPGGDSILGAQAQKDVTVWTSYLTLAFLALSFFMVIFDPDKMYSAGATGAGTEEPSVSAPADGEGTPGDGEVPIPVDIAPPTPPGGVTPPAGGATTTPPADGTAPDGSSPPAPAPVDGGANDN